MVSVIAGIRDSFPECEILVLNDGSTDRTAILARGTGCLVMDLPIHFGYGNTLQTGYKYALQNDYEYVIQVDGDGQHDPGSIEVIFKELIKAECDIIIGSRFFNNNYKTPFLRKLGMRLFAKMAGMITNEAFSDPTSGFRGFNKKAIKLYCKDLYPSDFPDVDLIIMSTRCGLKIKEVPVNMRPASGRKSMHSGLRPVYYVFKMFLSIAVNLLRNKDI